MSAVLGLTFVYLALFAITVAQRARNSSAVRWLAAYTLYSALLMAVHAVIIPQTGAPIPRSAQLLAGIGFVIGIALASLLTLSHLARKRRDLFWFMVPAGAWSAALIVAGMSGAGPLGGGRSAVLSTTRLTLAAQIGVVGWVVITLLLIVLTWRTFLREPLPLYANRSLYWSFVLPVLLLGEALSAWINPPLNYIGYAVRLIGVAAAVHGIIAHRVLDLRNVLRWVMVRAILALVTLVLVFLAMLTPYYVRLPGLGSAEHWVVMGGAALVVAIILPLVSELIQWPLKRLLRHQEIDASRAMQIYSQRVVGVVELSDLAATATHTIRRMLSVRRAALIMASTSNDGHIVLEAVNGHASPGAMRCILADDSPILAHFLEARRPLLQFDIDRHPAFANVSQAEREYFEQLLMDIYAPVVTDDRLAGLLAIGPKVSDEPFQPDEIDLLGALANQTVSSLEIARLVTNLRELNRRMTVLNEGLQASNEHLERLDAVKSDFLALATHELFTPLTQVRGDAQLLPGMLGPDVLEDEEISESLERLDRASLRLTNIYQALVDVTQLDLQNLEMDFERVNLAELVKQATQPYAEVLNERRLRLVARGLAAMPTIFADAARMNQVFDNLISNAIKFTPDGGYITILGQIYEKDSEGRPRSVRISIKDTGIGIDERDQALIFEKFYRVDPVNTHSSGRTKFRGGGPGLGLPICLGIVEAHGGQITVESTGYDEERLPGSTFMVVLPIVPPALESRRRIEAFKQQWAEEASLRDEEA
jgi:signal transduction histidine kinase